MKTMMMLCAIVLASLLVMIAEQNSNGQGTAREEITGFVAAIGPEQRKELLKPLLSELLNDRELKRELVKEISRSIGPEAVKILSDSIASECARDPQFRKEVLRFVVGAASTQLKETFASASRGNRSLDPAALMSLISSVTSRGIAGGMLASGRASGQPGAQRENREPELWGDSVAAFVNPENEVKTLSADQVRKLFTGEFTNWKQVGGPDLSVEVVSWNEGLSAIEDLVGKRVAPGAVRLRYLSLIIPAVSRSRGAVGFLSVGSVERLPFIAGHEAIRTVVISDTGATTGTSHDQVVDSETQQTVDGLDKVTPLEDRERPLVTLTTAH